MIRSLQLVSLHDMLTFHAAGFVSLAMHLEQAKMCLIIQPLEDALPKLENELEGIIVALDGLPVSASLQAQATRARNRTRTLKRDALILLVSELQANMQEELDTLQFLCLSAPDGALFNKPQRWWLGETLPTALEEAFSDMRACAQCLALGQPTASVFHAMQVAQYGLRALCDRLGVTFATSFELENWKNIIDKIESAIRAIESNPKSTQKSEDLQFYSKAAAHFFYIKEAWRNHVSHGRGRYSDAEARLVGEHVRDLMSAIAARA